MGYKKEVVCRMMSDAEAVKACCDAITAVPDLQGSLLEVRLSHTSLLEAALSHAGAPPEARADMLHHLAPLLATSATARDSRQRAWPEFVHSLKVRDLNFKRARLLFWMLRSEGKLYMS